MVAPPLTAERQRATASRPLRNAGSVITIRRSRSTRVMGTDKLTAVVSAKGAARWTAGHPWIYRSDVLEGPRGGPGIVRVQDRRGAFLGMALYSPRSEIRLRLLATEDAPIDADWWTRRIGV